MLIGYMRVSTDDQNLDLQSDALKKVGCIRIFEDTASGAKSDRPGLEKALSYLRQGDTLVWKLDRLGRSLKHLIEVLSRLHNEEKTFRSLQENLDTSTSTGKLIFHVFGALAEFERDLIRDRTLAGLAAARSRGRIGGRPPAMDHQKIAMARSLMEDRTVPIVEICRILEISKATLYKYLNLNNQTTKTEEKNHGS